MSRPILPTILSGGSGVRLWPLSRPDAPKQLISLVDDRTMLLATLHRLEGIDDLLPPVVVCNAAHTTEVRQDLTQAGTGGRIIVEPMGRNTAPAVAAAAVAAGDDDPVLLVMPADHLIQDVAAFHDAVAIGAEEAAAGRLVTFGIVPNRPATGYGYIRAEGEGPVRSVAEFVEKPDADLAAKFVATGDYLWNSGMFMFTASSYRRELAAHAPAILEAVEQAVATGITDDGEHRLDATAFGAAPSISIDYAVMEHTDDAVVVPLDAGWTDVGSWDSLHEIGETDTADNIVVGNAVIRDVVDSYVRSEGPLVAAVGVANVIVVATNDAVLVAKRTASEDVKSLVEQLAASARIEATVSASHRRNWGRSTRLASTDATTVDRCDIAPGSSVALPTGTWVVASGTAHSDGVEFDTGASLVVPAGSTRLVAAGEHECVVVGIQPSASSAME